MPSKVKTRQSGSRKNTPNDKNSSVSYLTDSSQIIANVLGNSSSLNTSGRRSLGLRISLPHSSGSQETEVEDDAESVVTDVEEKNEIRNAQATLDHLSANRSKKVASDSKNFLITKLSKEELEVHYSQCIELFSKNKVNVKNAFKLQLIDFMKLMMDRKTDKSDNLVLMSCTLDASAKIYSCRVDNVYSNILKFVKSYQSGGKIKDDDKGKDLNSSKVDDSGGEASSDDENSGKKPDKKKKKDKRNVQNFVKEPESFSRKELKMCYYRQNLPRNQLYFLKSSVLDDGHKLAPNRPLFADFTPGLRNSSTIALDSIWRKGIDRDNFEEKISGYKDLRSKVFIADDGPEEDDLNSENAFTFDPSVESIAEMKTFNEISDGQSDHGNDDVQGDMEVDYDDYDMEPLESDSSAVEKVSLQNSEQSSKHSVSFTPIAMSRMLRSSASKHSDYSFFDDSKLAFMPSAAHWKIKASKRSLDAVGKTPTHTRRGKTSYLDFISLDLIISSLEANKEDSNHTYKLSIKTTKDWFHKKTELVFLAIIPNIRKRVLSLFKDPETCILNVVRKAAPEKECDINESVLLNPSDFSTADAISLDDFGDDNDGDGGYHPLEDGSEKMDHDADNARVSDGAVNSTGGDDVTNVETLAENVVDSLVPVPMKVEKVVVKFAKAQKRIDIKKLKGAIWNLLDLEKLNSENKENDTKVMNQESKTGDVKYSEIYKQIPSSITKEAAAELSYPIAFMAILHMANEKNLCLRGNKAHSDFTVSFDSPP